MTPHQQIARVLELLPQDRATLAEALGVSQATLLGWLRGARGEVLPARAAGRAPPPEEALVAAWGLLEAHGRRVAEVLGRLAPAPGDRALESAADSSKNASFRRFRALEAARERVGAACEALALAANLGDDDAADRAVALRVVVGLRQPVRPAAPALSGACPNCGDPHSDCPCPA